MNLKNTIDVAFVSNQKLTTWHLRNKLLMHWPIGIHWLHAIADYCPDRSSELLGFCFYFSLFFRFSAVRWPPRQLLSLRKSTASYRIVSYHGPTFLLNLVARIPIYRFLCYSLYYPYPFQTHTHHFLFYFLHLPFIISIVLACDVIVVYPSICPYLTTRSSRISYEMAKRRITQTTPHNIAKEF